MEGTSGRHEPSAFTSRWSRRPWRLPHAGKAAHTARKSSTRPLEGRAKALPRSRGRGRGDKGVRGKIGSRRRGKITPTLLLSPTGDGERELEAKTGSACLATIRRSVHECCETLGPPVIPHEAQDFVNRASDSFERRWSPRGESRGASRERTKYGCTYIVQVAEVGRTHRASCPPGVPQGLVVGRTGR